MSEEIKQIIAAAHFKDEDIIQPPPLITIGGKTIATEGNFITISGLPKSRKTTFAFLMAAAAITGQNLFDIQVNTSQEENILLIDTEQSIFDFSKQIGLLKHFIGTKKLPKNFNAYLFRKYDVKEILQSLYTLMQEQKPKIVILDNLTELAMNVNDPIETKTLIQFLKRITAEFNCVVVCLLHLGKGGINTLGHLGSFSDRGAQSTLKVTKDKDTDISTLEPIFLRSDANFNPISIFFNPDTKHYEQTEATNTKPVKKSILDDLTEADHYAKMSLIFAYAKRITYAELWAEIKKYYGVGANIAKQKIIPLLLSKKILISDKGIYKLI